MSRSFSSEPLASLERKCDLRDKKNEIASPINTKPPITPPAIAPTLLDLLSGMIYIDLNDIEATHWDVLVFDVDVDVGDADADEVEVVVDAATIVSLTTM